MRRGASPQQKKITTETYRGTSLRLVKKFSGEIFMSNTLIIIGGIFHLGFAVFHLFFWRLFNWKKDLASLTYINRAVMQILNLCLTFVFFVAAYISIFHSRELVATSLGNVILVSISAFWLLRFIEQIIFFGLKKRLSITLTVLFFAGFVIYLFPLFFIV